MLLKTPIIEKGMYLTDGERLYFVCNVKKDKVFVENCSTLLKFSADFDFISHWTEVHQHKS